MKRERHTLAKRAALTALTGILLFPFSGLANDEELGEGEIHRNWFVLPMGGSLYFLGGVGLFDADPLSERFEDAGYSDVEEPFFPMGLGLGFHMGRLRFALEWNATPNFRMDSEDENLQLDTYGGYWLARLGVDVVRWKGLSVYPIVGIGSSYVGVRVATETGGAFDELLANPRRELWMSQMSLVLDVSLGVDYRIWVTKTRYRKSYVLVGVRGGYLFSLYDGGWDVTGAEVSAGPDNILSGAVIQIMIGVGHNMNLPMREERDEQRRHRRHWRWYY